MALSSDEYLRSIEEARTDYKEGRIKYLDSTLPDKNSKLQ